MGSGDVVDGILCDVVSGIVVVFLYIVVVDVMAAVVGFVVPIVDLAAAVEVDVEIFVEPTYIPSELKNNLVLIIYSNNILF